MLNAVRNLNVVLLSAGFTFCAGAAPVSAKHVRVPKHCPVKVQKTADATVFSSPDAQDDITPGFVGKKGQPLNMEMDRIYAFDPGKLLGDLTKEQRQKIKTVQETTNGNVQSIQEQIRALNPKADAAEIAALRKQIVEKRKESSLLLEAVLTEPQRDKLQRMRHGEIVQDRNEDRKDSQR